MMEVPTDPGCDFLANLKEKDLWHVIDIIFQYLSYDDLKTAKSVSPKWKEVITTEEYWKKRLKKKVRQSQDWKDMLSYIETTKPDLLQRPDRYRKVYKLTAAYLEKQEINWKGGYYRGSSRRSLESPPCLVQSPRHSWNQDLFPPLANQSFAMNNKWIVTAGENSKITIRNRFELREIIKVLDIPEIASLPFPRDAPRRPLIYSVKANNLFIIACFYYHSEVCVWDATTHDLIRVLDGDLFSANRAPIHNPWHAIFLDENLIGTIHGGGAEIMLSLYKISSEPVRKVSIVYQGGLSKEESDIRTVLDAYMDHNTIVMMFACERGGFMLEIRDISSKRTTRIHLGAFSDLKPLCFHYQCGLICIGTKAAIIFYDAKAGSLLKSMPTNFGNIYDIKLIKDKYLVVCGPMGTLNIFDLKKILNPSARDAIIASSLFNIPSQDLWNDFTSVPRPSLQVVDEHQICLAIQFHTISYSLFTFDFINRDFLKSRRNVLPFSSYPYVG